MNHPAFDKPLNRDTLPEFSAYQSAVLAYERDRFIIAFDALRRIEQIDIGGRAIARRALSEICGEV